MARQEKQLAGLLRDARANAGFSQKEVADFLGYSTPQFVSNWERGIESPPCQALDKLARLFKIPSVELQELFIQEALKNLEKELRRELRKKG